MKNQKYLFVIILAILLSGPQFKCSENVKINTDLITSLNSFAFDVYHQISSENENLLFSPFSLSEALLMTYAGARNETQLAMAKCLHISEIKENIHEEVRIANHLLNTTTNKNNVIKLANSLWADKNWQFLDSYISLVKEQYGSEIKTIDLRNGISAAEEINNWVSNNTNDKITEIVNPDDFDLARLVLANAIYFNGTWKYSFDKKNNEKSWFVTNGKNKIEAEYMVLSDSLKYYHNKRMKLLELPYANNDFSIFFMLPDKRTGIQNFEKLFEQGNFSTWHDSLQTEDVLIKIPKFKVEHEIELKEALSKMGMEVAFSKSADFSGMTGRKDLQIDKVKHKAFLEIDERGTEASAATVVIMREKSAPLKEMFIANHPFLFLIMENNTGLILFMGKIDNPST